MRRISESKTNEYHKIVEQVDMKLLLIAKGLGLYVDLTDKKYEGDKEPPMDRIGLLDHLIYLVQPVPLNNGIIHTIEFKCPKCGHTDMSTLKDGVFTLPLTHTCVADMFDQKNV